METTEYKCLQSQFSVLYNESMQIKTQLEEARSMLATSKYCCRATSWHDVTLLL